MDNGSWWERKKGKEAKEIDIIAVYSEGRRALVAEVKRQKRNYNHKEFMSKVDRIKGTILERYEIETRLFTLEDI